MVLVIDSPKTFLADLAAASSVIEKNSVVPITRLVKLLVADGVLTITGTNIDGFVEVRNKEHHTDPFQAVVNPSELSNVIGVNPFSLTVADDGTVIFHDNDVDLPLETGSIEEFPDTPIGDISFIGKINAKKFLDKVRATPNKVNRFSVDGLVVDAKGYLMNTNSHTLHAEKFTALSEFKTFIIPKQALTVAARFAPEPSLRLMTARNTDARYSVLIEDNKTIIYRSPEKGFPVNWHKVIQKEINGPYIEVFLDPKIMVENLDRFLKVNREEEVVKFTFSGIEGEGTSVEFKGGKIKSGHGYHLFAKFLLGHRVNIFISEKSLRSLIDFSPSSRFFFTLEKGIDKEKNPCVKPGRVFSYDRTDSAVVVTMPLVPDKSSDTLPLELEIQILKED